MPHLTLSGCNLGEYNYTVRPTTLCAGTGYPEMPGRRSTIGCGAVASSCIGSIDAIWPRGAQC